MLTKYGSSATYFSGCLKSRKNGTEIVANFISIGSLERVLAVVFPFLTYIIYQIVDNELHQPLIVFSFHYTLLQKIPKAPLIIVNYKVAP